MLGVWIVAVLSQPEWYGPFDGLVAHLYDRTIFAPALAMFIRCLPIALLVAWYGFRSLPSEVLPLFRGRGHFDCFRDGHFDERPVHAVTITNGCDVVQDDSRQR